MLNEFLLSVDLGELGSWVGVTTLILLWILATINYFRRQFSKEICEKCGK